MFRTFYNNIQKMWVKFIASSHYMSELDRYIASKHPQSPAEIEHWIKQFDHQQQKGWLV